MQLNTDTNRAAPTATIADELQRAFDFYNGELFDGMLPDCVLKFHRNPRALGYFWAARYKSTDEHDAHELALNPDHIRERSLEEALSTLVHEMVHLWQQEFGKPGRKGYHNRQWADQMDSVGLTPTDTGQEGGKRTGQKMTHMIVAGGPFATATAKLLATGFALTWASFPAPKAESKTTRSKYVCPDCDTAVWGKPGLRIECQPCGREMIGDGDTTDREREDE